MEEDATISEEIQYDNPIINGPGFVFGQINDNEQDVNSNEHPVSDKSVTQTCTRCGRSNHMLPKCYAKTDISGKKLDPTSVISSGKKLDSPSSITSSKKQKVPNTNPKYIRFCKKGKWITIPNKNYVSRTKSLPSTDNYGMLSYITQCTIL
jgi:hypothetical protein